MCGRKRKASTLVRNWQGMWRCPEHDEPRQTQDFVRGVPDNMGVPFAQPPQESFVFLCSINSSCALPGLAGPGCSIPGRTFWDPNGVM